MVQGSFETKSESKNLKIMEFNKIGENLYFYMYLVAYS